MRLLLFLLLLLSPTLATADDDTPPWDTGDDDEEGEGEKTPAPEEDKPAPQPEPEPQPEPAPLLGAYRTGGPVGLGFSAGTLNGFSLKIWPAREHGIVFNLGSPLLLNAVGMNVGYRYHLPAITPRGTTASIHLSIGGAFRTRLVFYNNGTFVEIGGGLAIGASVTLSDAPIEFWAEVIPAGVGGVNPAGVGVGFDVDGLVGVRFFPGG